MSEPGFGAKEPPPGTPDQPGWSANTFYLLMGSWAPGGLQDWGGVPTVATRSLRLGGQYEWVVTNLATGIAAITTG